MRAYYMVLYVVFSMNKITEYCIFSLCTVVPQYSILMSTIMSAQLCGAVVVSLAAKSQSYVESITDPKVRVQAEFIRIPSHSN